MIKAVCDRADAQKSDAWHDEAADRAASWRFSFFESHPDWIVPKTSGGYQLTDTARLIFFLSESFTKSELEVMTVSLDEDWDEIPGDTKTLKAASLIQHLKRRGKLPGMYGYIERVRPGAGLQG